MSESVQVLSMELPCDLHAPGAVRHALDDSASLGRLLEDGLLVASELVTNAVLHSGCADDQTINVRAELFGDHLLISVHDPGLSGRDAAPTQAEPFSARARPSSGGGDPPSAIGKPPFDGGQDGGEEGGLGLQIVDMLARRWGAERPNGYLVWAELARPG